MERDWSLVFTLSYFIFIIYTAICWVINIIFLFQCDFDAPYKEEFVHGLGILFPPAAGLTVWY